MKVQSSKGSKGQRFLSYGFNLCSNTKKLCESLRKKICALCGKITQAKTTQAKNLKLET